jgi:hypothetical protein
VLGKFGLQHSHSVGFFGTPRGLHIATTEIWLVFQVEFAATAFSNASIAAMIQGMSA